MRRIANTRQEVIDAIHTVARELGRAPSMVEFRRHSGIHQRHVDKHFDGWNDAVKAAGLEPNTRSARIDDTALLEDWGRVVRDLRGIPTLSRYAREGRYSVEVLRRFGAWSNMPEAFREFADGKGGWADVVALLPVPRPGRARTSDAGPASDAGVPEGPALIRPRHSRLKGRPTYGNPIDFRGLRHEPVNEQGVVFLFGMVAKEMGYMVEAVQTGYPDCEAKRQTGPNSWQRVRIEFEFESRNFRDHGHSPDGCDLIVCWRHNWPECPAHLEVVELASAIQELSKDED